MKCFAGGGLKKVLYVFLCCMLLVGSLMGNIYAIEVDEKFIQNDIIFYEPKGDAKSGKCGTLLGRYKGVPIVGLSVKQSEFVDVYYPIALKYGVKYGIPWEAVMAQGIHESAAGASDFAKNRNNFFGTGAFDSNTDKVFKYGTLEKGWEGYYKKIKNTQTHDRVRLFSYPNDPYGYITAIASIYALDEDYVSKVKKLIDAIVKGVVGEERGYKLSKDNPANDPNISKEFPMDPSCVGIGSALIENGGFSFEEAKQFMEKYKKVKPGDYGLIKFSACSSALANCVAFVKYFLKEYTTLPVQKNRDFSIGNGKDVAGNLVRNYHLKGGDAPKPFAIFSIASGTVRCSDNLPCGHTGVILGVHDNEVIIGEANCGAVREENAFTVRKKAVKDMILGDYTFAYTDEILRKGGE